MAVTMFEKTKKGDIGSCHKRVFKNMYHMLLRTFLYCNMHSDTENGDKGNGS